MTKDLQEEIRKWLLTQEDFAVGTGYDELLGKRVFKIPKEGLEKTINFAFLKLWEEVRGEEWKEHPARTDLYCNCKNYAPLPHAIDCPMRKAEIDRTDTTYWTRENEETEDYIKVEIENKLLQDLDQRINKIIKQ